VPDDLRASLARDHLWVRVRLLGWSLIGLWQAAGLLALFVPLDLDGRPVRIAAAACGLLGTVLVAAGFERIVAEGHRRLGEGRGAGRGGEGA
jgi:hypothetical protein